MYDPNALPPPPGMFGITSMPQTTAAPRPGTAPNALAGLTRPTRQPGSVYGGGISLGGYPAMPSLPNMPAMPGYAGGAGAGRPGMPAMPTLPGGMPSVPGMPPGNTGVVPPGTPNSQVPGAGGAGSWIQSFMGPNGFDQAAFRTAMDAWRQQRRDWRDARPDRQGFEGDQSAWRAGLTDWRSDRPTFQSYFSGLAAPAAAPVATDPAGIAAAAAVMPPVGYDPFGG